MFGGRTRDAVVFDKHAEISGEFPTVEHSEGLVAHARVAKEDDQEDVCFEVAHCCRMPDPPSLEAVLQPDHTEHQRRDDEDADHPLGVEVEQAGGETVELEDLFVQNFVSD